MINVFRKGLTLHMEIAHQQSGKMTSELVKKNLGLSFAEIIENAQRLSVKRTAPTQNVSNNIIKKIRFNSGDRESVLRNKTLELREVKDSGLICVSCQSDEENNIEEDEEEENLMQSITELQNHIILKHRDIIVNESFVFIQNTAAGHKFTSCQFQTEKIKHKVIPRKYVCGSYSNCIQIS